MIINMDVYKDGQWFTLKNNHQRGLNGYRKTGICHGSLICTCAECLKLATGNIVNTIDFRRRGGEMFECSSFGYLASHIFCGCIKVIEYDKESQVLTYYHQGTHCCTLKPNVCERHKVLDRLPLLLTCTSKAQRCQKNCMQYYMGNGDID